MNERAPFQKHGDQSKKRPAETTYSSRPKTREALTGNISTNNRDIFEEAYNSLGGVPRYLGRPKEIPTLSAEEVGLEEADLEPEILRNGIVASGRSSNPENIPLRETLEEDKGIITLGREHQDKRLARKKSGHEASSARQMARLDRAIQPPSHIEDIIQRMAYVEDAVIRLHEGHEKLANGNKKMEENLLAELESLRAQLEIPKVLEKNTILDTSKKNNFRTQNIIDPHIREIHDLDELHFDINKDGSLRVKEEDEPIELDYSPTTLKINEDIKEGQLEVGDRINLPDLEASEDGTLRFNGEDEQKNIDLKPTPISKQESRPKRKPAAAKKEDIIEDWEIEDATRYTPTEKAREAMQTELNRLGEEMGIIIDARKRAEKTLALQKELASIEEELGEAQKEAESKKETHKKAGKGEKAKAKSTLAIAEGKVKRLEEKYSDTVDEYWHFATLPKAEDEILDTLKDHQETLAATNNPAQRQKLNHEIYTLRRMQSLLKDAETWVNPIEAENYRRAESRRKAAESWKKHLESGDELSVKSEEESREIRMDEDLQKARADWLGTNSPKNEIDFADTVAQQGLKDAKKAWEKSLEPLTPSANLGVEMKELDENTTDFDFDIDIGDDVETEKLPAPPKSEKPLSPLERQMGSRAGFYDIPPEKEVLRAKRDIPTTIQKQTEQDEEDNQRLASYQAEKTEKAAKRAENVAFYRNKLKEYRGEIKQIANELTKYNTYVEIPGERNDVQDTKRSLVGSLLNATWNRGKIAKLQEQYQTLMDRYQETEDTMKAVEQGIRAHGRPILGQGAGARVTNEAPPDAGYLRERNEQETYQKLSEEIDHLQELYRDLPTMLLTGSKFDGFALEPGQARKKVAEFTQGVTFMNEGITTASIRKIERTTLKNRLKDLDTLYFSIANLPKTNIEEVRKQELLPQIKDSLKTLRSYTEKKLALLEAKAATHTDPVERRKAAATIKELSKIVGGKSEEEITERITLTLEAAARLPYLRIDPILKDKLFTEYTNRLKAIEKEIGTTPTSREAIERLLP